MKKFEISKSWYYLILAIIITLSYLHFSVIYNSFLDISSAITVLMVPGYSVPGDLYLWGQNFSGSLVAFLAQILNTTYRFPPAMAVSVVHYLILLLGFITLSTLFKSRVNKLLLCILWFLPFWHASSFLWSVFGLQSSLVAITIYCFNQFKANYSERIKLVWLSALCLSVILALWISDLSIISLFILLIVLFISYWKKNIFGEIWASIRSKEQRSALLTVVLWVLVGIGFIWYGKSHAAKTFSLYSPLIASLSDIINSIKIVSTSLKQILIFNSGNFLESLFTWCSLGTIIWLFVTSKFNASGAESSDKRSWFYFYFFNALILFVIMLISNWAAMNGQDRRYYSIVSISFFISLLFYLELSSHSKASLRKKLLLLLFFIGAMSSIYPHYFPSSLKPSLERMADLKSLGNVGILAESQTAYLTSASDPSHIKSSPYDKEYIRNFNLTLDVLKQERIYLVKEGWLTAFPDTIQQFNRVLQRIGEPFKKAGLELCRYEKIVKRWVYTIPDMKYQGQVFENDTNAYSRQTVMITPDFDRGKHFIYGPFKALDIGKYIVYFRLMVSRDLATDNVAVLDVAANGAKEILTSKTIRLCDFEHNHHYEEFELPFETTKDYASIEFRIMFLGGTDMTFDRVLLVQKQN